MRREKDEDALLDFISTSFVFPDTETEHELEKDETDVGPDEESLDAEEEEEKEFIAKVSDNPLLSSMLQTGGGGISSLLKLVVGFA